MMHFRRGKSTGCRRSLVLLILLQLSSPAFADKLVYSFKNPTFGGNPFASGHFINLANTQFTPPEKPKVVVSDAEYFADQVQRRALSSISSILLGGLRDLELSDTGSFQFDGLAVDFYSELGTIYFTIDDGINTINLELPDVGSMISVDPSAE